MDKRENHLLEIDPNYTWRKHIVLIWILLHMSFCSKRSTAAYEPKITTNMLMSLFTADAGIPNQDAPLKTMDRRLKNFYSTSKCLSKLSAMNRFKVICSGPFEMSMVERETCATSSYKAMLSTAIKVNERSRKVFEQTLLIDDDQFPSEYLHDFLFLLIYSQK